MTNARPRAVVFGYHDVGARCLRVLRAHGVDVTLVVTHDDDPAETQWFERVADVADDLGIRWIAPRDANDPGIVARVGALAPEFLFSFYYRKLLRAPLLALPSRGALNMHGSLLPRYRGRAPVNWAVLNGETMTGATLHYMDARPDAGDIVDQRPVPILPDDTAKNVADKVTVIAEVLLDATLPALIAGSAPRRRNAIELGSYFGGRTPDDGRIDWSQPAQVIHNLVRAVAPPYPGALTTIAGAPARVLRTRMLDADAPALPPALNVVRLPRRSTAADAGRHDAIVAHCGGGGTLRVDDLEIDGNACTAAMLAARFGDGAIPLG
jgi:methionyl-tRNA formyltransferase